jgi:protein-S-isoprenylcysteine O-methyltransferase Ste14
VANLHPWTAAIVAGVLTVAQVVLMFFLNNPGIEVVRTFGYLLWSLSAVFGVLPIFTLRAWGGVPSGKSYVHTTQLVRTGIYAIVRHPQQGTAWYLINLAAALIAQHWVPVLLGVASMVLVRRDLQQADQDALDKFGDAYRDYMAEVPQVNFLSGLVRWFERRAD